MFSNFVSSFFSTHPEKFIPLSLNINRFHVKLILRFLVNRYIAVAFLRDRGAASYKTWLIPPTSRTPGVTSYILWENVKNFSSNPEIDQASLFISVHLIKSSGKLHFCSPTFCGKSQSYQPEKNIMFDIFMTASRVY